MDDVSTFCDVISDETHAPCMRVRDLGKVPRASGGKGMQMLAVLVCQVKGVRLHDVGRRGVPIRERLSVQRARNLHHTNCLNVKLRRNQLLLGHVEAPVAALLSPLICDLSVEVAG